MSKVKNIHKRYEDELDRRASKSYKIQQREQAEKEFNSRRHYCSINTDEDDYSDIDEMFEDDDLQ
jgi:hypothetical protein